MLCNPNISKITKKIKQKTGIEKDPDLVFYLSLSQDPLHPNSCNSTVFNSINIGPTNKLQTSFSPLYKDYDLQCFLGKNSSNVTIYNFKKPDECNLFYSTVNTEYRLPEGTIGISHTPQLQFFGNFYGLPANDIEICQITFGTGTYLNKTGTLIIVTGETTTKIIFVFFS